nr:hypothetical protein [Tanacetum cinerariifolium]
MIQVKEMMQDKDLKNSKSKDKGSRSRSQSMNEQIITNTKGIPKNLKTLAKGFYPPSLNFLSFNWESPKDHFEIALNSKDDISSSDDDSLYNENIEYLEASPHDSELVSLEAAEIVIPEVEEIEGDNLREKLLNVHLLIANIEALKDNPTPSSEFLTKSSSTSPKSFLEETNTFHNSLPEFENFYFDLEEISSGSTTIHSNICLSDYEVFPFYDDHIEEISSGSTTTHSDISLPDYEAFYFYDDHIEEISSGSTTTHSDISLSEYDPFIFDLSNDQFTPTDRIEDDYSPLLAYVVWIFLAYLKYPVIPPYLHSFGNRDTIFDPGITINHVYSFKPGLSHRSLEKCECFEKELSKSKMMSKSFEALQKHAINLELDLQQCQEKIKNDKSFKENQSKEFRKEREQYFEIQDLKAQLQDKGIAISELKKLIEKLKGKSVDTKFEKSLVIRQSNAFKSQRPLILGKPTIFSDFLEREDCSKSKTKMPMAMHVSTREPKGTVNQSVTTPLRRTVASKSTNQKPRHTTRKLYEHVSKACSWWYPKFTPPGYKWKSKSKIGIVNPKVSMPLGNASRTANILERMTPRRSTVSNTTLYSNSFAARKDYPIHRSVKFENDQIAPILGYGDLVQGIVTVKKGNDLLIGSLGTDLYSITLQDTSSP